MEFKKCVRCGCFFVSSIDVCCKCEAKDKQDIYNLNNYMDACPYVPSIDGLSFNTGVSVKNIDRFIQNNNISIT